MKNILFLLALFPIIVHGQVITQLRKSTPINKEKLMLGHKITRLEGKPGMGGLTNVGYYTYDDLIAEYKKESEEQMWPEEKKNIRVLALDTYNKGGMLFIFIDRYTIEAANFKYFSVIIKDTLENELYREDCPESIPEYSISTAGNSSTTHWWNLYTINFVNVMPKTFYVYIIDKLSSKIPKYKFRVRV